MWSITLDEKLYLAPINLNPQNVLDIGTGTGIWAIDFGIPLSFRPPTSYFLSHFHFKVQECEVFNSLLHSGCLSFSPSNRNRFIPHNAKVVSDLPLYLREIRIDWQWMIEKEKRLTQTISIPPNCQFEINDAEDDWLFPQKFDFIHGRTLATCFKEPLSIIKKVDQKSPFPQTKPIPN